jgi:dolichyl-phosphate beta-glucosyltransferase
MNQENSLISVVLPVYNNKRLAEQSVRRVYSFLEQHYQTFEVLVIDDGSTQDENLASITMPHKVRVIHNQENKGKGYSVKRGMLAAQGDVRIYTDIDLPYDLTFILKATKLILEKEHQFVAGNRLHSKSELKQLPSILRIAASFLFRKTLPLLILGRVYDTQCGFKACSAALTKKIFPLITIDRFAFDMELFYILKKNHIAPTFLPVTLINSHDSSVKLFRDGPKAIIDALTIPIRWHLK